VPAFRVKLGDDDLNCVDVPLNPTHSLTHSGKMGHLKKQGRAKIVWQ